MWAKIDCGFFRDVRIASLTTAQREAFLRLILWTHEAGEDGHVPETALKVIGLRAQSLRSLVAVGLLTENGSGWYVTNYAKHQVSRGVREETRQVRAEAGRKGAHARWHKP